MGRSIDGVGLGGVVAARRWGGAWTAWARGGAPISCHKYAKKNIYIYIYAHPPLTGTSVYLPAYSIQLT